MGKGDEIPLEVLSLINLLLMMESECLDPPRQAKCQRTIKTAGVSCTEKSAPPEDLSAFWQENPTKNPHKWNVIMDIHVSTLLYRGKATLHTTAISSSAPEGNGQIWHKSKLLVLLLPLQRGRQPTKKKPKHEIKIDSFKPPSERKAQPTIKIRHFD